MRSAKKAASSRETGRHRGEPKSRWGTAIVIGTIVLVLWAAIWGVFAFQSGSPQVMASAEYTPPPAVPAPQPLPSRAPAPVKLHTAVRGDSLWSVAREECGNGNDWKKVAIANKIWWPWLVKQGKVMIVDC